MGKPKKRKNPAAVALGRARMLALTPEQRRELGRRAIAIRWAKERAKKKARKG
jgi:hypothetical protein